MTKSTAAQGFSILGKILFSDLNFSSAKTPTIAAAINSATDTGSKEVISKTSHSD
jgi:hypothetical protein